MRNMEGPAIQAHVPTSAIETGTVTLSFPPAFSDFRGRGGVSVHTLHTPVVPSFRIRISAAPTWLMVNIYPSWAPGLTLRVLRMAPSD